MLRELIAERRDDRDAIKDRVYSDARERSALMKRDPELFVGLEQLWVDLIEALRSVFGGREVVDVLIIDLRDIELRPIRRLHPIEDLERAKAPLEEPFGLILLG